LPATGTVGVLRPLGAVNPTTGEIRINGKACYLTVLPGGYRLTGYDARKSEVTVYDLPADLSCCDCPDHTFRGPRPDGGCKHMRALARLRAEGKLPDAPPAAVLPIPPDGLCPWCRERRDKCGCTDHDTAA
jgi:hypothetical protein